MVEALGEVVQPACSSRQLNEPQKSGREPASPSPNITNLSSKRSSNSHLAFLSTSDDTHSADSDLEAFSDAAFHVNDVRFAGHPEDDGSVTGQFNMREENGEIFITIPLFLSQNPDEYLLDPDSCPAPSRRDRSETSSTSQRLPPRPLRLRVRSETDLIKHDPRASARKPSNDRIATRPPVAGLSPVEEDSVSQHRESRVLSSCLLPSTQSHLPVSRSLVDVEQLRTARAHVQPREDSVRDSSVHQPRFVTRESDPSQIQRTQSTPSVWRGSSSSNDSSTFTSSVLPQGVGASEVQLPARPLSQRNADTPAFFQEESGIDYETARSNYSSRRPTRGFDLGVGVQRANYVRPSQQSRSGHGGTSWRPPLSRAASEETTGSGRPLEDRSATPISIHRAMAPYPNNAGEVVHTSDTLPKRVTLDPANIPTSSGNLRRASEPNKHDLNSQSHDAVHPSSAHPVYYGMYAEVKNDFRRIMQEDPNIHTSEVHEAKADGKQRAGRGGAIGLMRTLFKPGKTYSTERESSRRRNMEEPDLVPSDEELWM